MLKVSDNADFFRGKAQAKLALALNFGGDWARRVPFPAVQPTPSQEH